MMEMGQEWPNDEFGGLLSAIADAVCKGVGMNGMRESIYRAFRFHVY
jgi:hypothetical protein